MTSYKYIPASIAADAKKGTDPKQSYIDLFQETLNQQFYNASNWYTIQEETAIGSTVYENIDVRIAHVINAETGLKLGEDWKTLHFINVSHPAEIGKYYIFDNNVWVTVNMEFVKNLTGTCTIRRCNNTLRWIDEETGIYYEEPCAIEYLVKEPRNYATQGSPFMTPGGFLHIYTQLNTRTKKIKENQRFLFGNENHWMGYKVIGAGIGDFTNTKTYDNNSTNLLVLDLIADYKNSELDDFENGIADVYTNLYEIILSSGSIQGSIEDEIELTATVLYNGDTVDRTLLWESSNNTIATVSENGLVTCNALGTCEIKAGIENNPVYDVCWLTVSEAPEANYEILVSPDVNYILEGKQRTYVVYLYENNILLPNTFSISCSPNDVPSENYTFTGGSSTNNFIIENNLRDLNSYLTVQCTSGSYTKNMNIYLRGAWLHENI